MNMRIMKIMKIMTIKRVMALKFHDELEDLEIITIMSFTMKTQTMTPSQRHETRRQSRP